MTCCFCFELIFEQMRTIIQTKLVTPKTAVIAAWNSLAGLKGFAKIRRQCVL